MQKDDASVASLDVSQLAEILSAIEKSERPHDRAAAEAALERICARLPTDEADAWRHKARMAKTPKRITDKTEILQQVFAGLINDRSFQIDEIADAQIAEERRAVERLKKAVLLRSKKLGGYVYQFVRIARLAYFWSGGKTPALFFYSSFAPWSSSYFEGRIKQGLSDGRIPSTLIQAGDEEVSGARVRYIEFIEPTMSGGLGERKTPFRLSYGNIPVLAVLYAVLVETLGDTLLMEILAPLLRPVPAVEAEEVARQLRSAFASWLSDALASGHASRQALAISSALSDLVAGRGALARAFPDKELEPVTSEIIDDDLILKFWATADADIAEDGSSDEEEAEALGFKRFDRAAQLMLRFWRALRLAEAEIDQKEFVEGWNGNANDWEETIDRRMRKIEEEENEQTTNSQFTGAQEWRSPILDLYDETCRRVKWLNSSTQLPELKYFLYGCARAGKYNLDLTIGECERRLGSPISLGAVDDNKASVLRTWVVGKGLDPDFVYTLKNEALGDAYRSQFGFDRLTEAESKWNSALAGSVRRHDIEMHDATMMDFWRLGNIEGRRDQALMGRDRFYSDGLSDFSRTLLRSDVFAGAQNRIIERLRKSARSKLASDDIVAAMSDFQSDQYQRRAASYADIRAHVIEMMLASADRSLQLEPSPSDMTERGLFRLLASVCRPEVLRYFAANSRSGKDESKRVRDFNASARAAYRSKTGNSTVDEFISKVKRAKNSKEGFRSNQLFDEQISHSHVAGVPAMVRLVEELDELGARVAKLQQSHPGLWKKDYDEFMRSFQERYA
jgi:hypothetical protein